MVKRVDIKKLYRDSLINHFIDQGYTEFEAKIKADTILSSKKIEKHE